MKAILLTALFSLVGASGVSAPQTPAASDCCSPDAACCVVGADCCKAKAACCEAGEACCAAAAACCAK